jgi:hypothetical protein
VLVLAGVLECWRLVALPGNGKWGLVLSSTSVVRCECSWDACLHCVLRTEAKRPVLSSQIIRYVEDGHFVQGGEREGGC